jgi:hypothetical protein
MRQQSRAGQAPRNRPAGAGPCTIRSQQLQAMRGRTWRITLKLAGTYSSISMAK